jgi:hypothetical protein
MEAEDILNFKFQEEYRQAYINYSFALELEEEMERVQCTSIRPNEAMCFWYRHRNTQRAGSRLCEIIPGTTPSANGRQSKSL